MERRLSGVLAIAGLVVAFGIFLLGRRGSPDDLRAVAADLDALIRESAAGVKERADTLAQLPRISWAVATDEATVRDLTADELAFRTHPGEHIELTQMRKGGGEPRRLLRRPVDSDLELPLMEGTHVVVRENHLHLVTVVSIEPRERAELMVGILAVAKQLDTSAIEQRLAARGVNAELRTIQGSIVLAGSAPAPSKVEATIPLKGPAAEGVALVAANVGRPRWPLAVAMLVLGLFLAGSWWLWRRSAAAPSTVRFEARVPPPEPPEPPEPPPTHPEVSFPPVPPPPPPPRADDLFAPAPRLPPPQPAGRVTRTAISAPGARPPTPALGAKLPSPETRPIRPPTPPLGAKAAPPGPRPIRPGTPAQGAAKATPISGLPAIPEDAIPEVARERVHTGRVDISMTRTGSVSLAPRAAGAHADAADANADADPRTEAYRALFAEFVKMRKSTGESVDDLDPVQFVETLRDKRAQIMKQIPVRDVQFKLAFHNGKAAIRYLTVT